jgi:hypothetical protein
LTPGRRSNGKARGSARGGDTRELRGSALAGQAAVSALRNTVLHSFSQPKIDLAEKAGGEMVAWNHVTRDDVLRAIQEYDRLGPEQFFSDHGFGQSRSYELVWDKRHYPHKAILGVAYEFATGERLASGDFEGGKAGAVTVLGKLGFTVEPLR